MSIRFSVIVPVYNVERYLRECVDSILNQSGSDYEVLLIDDGSTDRSGSICEEYKEKYENVTVIHQENQGLSEARNAGVRNAAGEYFIFIDSDDYAAPDMLSEMEKTVGREKKPDLIIPCGWYKVYPKRIVLEDAFEAPDCAEGISGVEALRIYLKRNISGWTACGKAYRRQFWKEHQFRFRKGIYYEDADLIYKVVAAAENVRYVPASYYYRKDREGSILRNAGSKKAGDYLDILAEWEHYLNREPFEKEISDAIRATYAMEYVSSILPMIPSIRKQERPEILRKAKSIRCYLTYSDRRSVRLIRRCADVIGFYQTCYLLFIMKRIKGKIHGLFI